MKKIVAVVAIMAIMTLTETSFGADGMPIDKSNRSLASLVSGLQNGNKGLKVSCALTIGEYRFEDATDALSDVLKNDKDADVKFAVLVALYKIKTAAAVRELKIASQNLEDAYLRTVAEVLYTDIMRSQEAEGEYEVTAR